MKTASLTALITLLEKSTLTNWESHRKMAPAMRLQFTEDMIAKKKPRDAAVLVLLYPNKENEICILLTKRASYNGTHSGQISFPGGKKESQDKDLLETAIREAKEEIGIHPAKIKAIKALSKTYIPPSNFWVYPFLAYAEETPSFKNNYEVETILEIPLKELLETNNIFQKTITTSYMNDANVPCFKLNNEIVWGATAMILSELKDLILQPIK